MNEEPSGASWTTEIDRERAQQFHLVRAARLNAYKALLANRSKILDYATSKESRREMAIEILEAINIISFINTNSLEEIDFLAPGRLSGKANTDYMELSTRCEHLFTAIDHDAAEEIGETLKLLTLAFSSGIIELSGSEAEEILRFLDNLDSNGNYQGNGEV